MKWSFWCFFHYKTYYRMPESHLKLNFRCWKSTTRLSETCSTPRGPPRRAGWRSGNTRRGDFMVNFQKNYLHLKKLCMAQNWWFFPFFLDFNFHFFFCSTVVRLRRLNYLESFQEIKKKKFCSTADGLKEVMVSSFKDINSRMDEGTVNRS